MDAAADAFEQQKLIRHENLLWLLVAQGVVILPLLVRLPFWLWGVWLGAMVWRWQIYAGKWRFPSGVIKMLLGGLCVGGLVASYQGRVGVEPMVGFLVSAFVLKLLELRSRQDGLLLVFIGFIAVGTQFLFAQSMGAALYACIACAVLIAAWQTIYLTRHSTPKAKLMAGTILLVHSLPFMVVLFVVMPRLGPLWHVPLPKGAGATGFSDTLAPGDLGKLVKAGGTAFRVTFNQAPPAIAELYWRGLALDTFDGRSWQLDPQWDLNVRQARKPLGLGHLTEYSIMLEPHQYRWLFTLAEPIRVDSPQGRITITADGLIAAQDVVMSRMQYTLVSAPPEQLEWPKMSPQERRRWLQLPEDSNPQAKNLAQSLRAQNLSAQQIINKVLTLFHEQFYYTLEPPVLGKHSVDEFLFSSRRGFCEHFASSFAFLMRAAGVPARVIVGYQGGTFNPLENYWQVSQSDAHAWVEVWLGRQGWRRVDPTNAVAPERILQGIGNALSGQERGLIGRGQYEAPAWMTKLRQRADAASFVWHRWVLGYNPETQSQVLAKLLGGLEPWRVGLAFVGTCGLIMGLYVLWVIRPQWRKRSAFERALTRFDQYCHKRGFSRDSNETITAFSARLAVSAPELHTACQRLGLIAERALYADDARCANALIKALARFPKL